MDVDPPGSQEAEVNDPHNWNPLGRYLFLYRKFLDEHPLVPPGTSFEWEIVEAPDDEDYDTIFVSLRVDLLNGVRLDMEKAGLVEKTGPRRVRMEDYRYNAWYPGGHNVLRYDNHHLSSPDLYHRHVYDPRTGEQIEYTELTREQFPVLHQILDELLDLAPLDD